MIPILYSSTATDFSSCGNPLPDAISPHVVEARNGEFTLEMSYPVDGTNFDLIGMRSIIKAIPAPKKNPQPFRVYRITKPINGIVKIFAQHIHYDLEGIPVEPFTSTSLATALTEIKENMMVQNPFNFYTDKTSNTGMSLIAPASALNLLGGMQGSLLDTYGGEYEYDGFNIYLKASRGNSTDTVIRYGVNLIDLEQEENCANLYTGVLAFWKSGQDDSSVTGDLQSVGTFDFTRIKLLDRSPNYLDPPTKAMLNNDAVSYINEAKVGVPKVSINVKFVDLQQIEEYALDGYTLKLCDLVTVKFEKLGVSATAKIIRTDFDVITERYISLDIGDARTNMGDTIIGISTKAETAPTATEMQQAIAATTAAITGANGGAVRLLDTNDDGLPDTLYIADNADPLLATKVWRFNYEGWGASEYGYSGPFTMGATFLEGIIADFITAGTLDASLVNVENLSADSITSGTLDASQITVTNLNADNITTGMINGQRIENYTITGNKIGTGQITGGVDSYGRATGNLAALTITGSNIADTTLPGDKMEWHTIGDLQIDNVNGLSTASLSGGINRSLGYADFSNGVFNNTKTADYCRAKDITCDHILSADDRAYLNRLYVGRAGTYYEATWTQIAIPAIVNNYLLVYDSNDQYIGYTQQHLMVSNVNNVWVLAH